MIAEREVLASEDVVLPAPRRGIVREIFGILIKHADPESGVPGHVRRDAVRSSVDHHQGLGHEGERRGTGQSQREIPILVDSQGIVEHPGLGQQAALDQQRLRRRRIDHQRVGEDVALRRSARPFARNVVAMLLRIIDRAAVTGAAIRACLQHLKLGLQLLGEPAVVAVLERQVAPTGEPDADVPGARRAKVLRVAHRPETGIVGISRERVGRVVRGRIVDGDQLDIAVRLPEHAVDGARHEAAAVVHWQNDRNCRYFTQRRVSGSAILSRRAHNTRVLPHSRSSAARTPCRAAWPPCRRWPPRRPHPGAAPSRPCGSWTARGAG